MAWLNAYIIGIIVSYLVFTVADALTNRIVNSFYHILGYAFLWPFYWIYFLINAITRD